MAKRTDREGIVIDADREPEASRQPARSADGHLPGDPKKRPCSPLGIVLSLCAITMTVAGLFFGYQHWSALKQEMSALDSRFSEGLQAQRSLAEAVNQAKGVVQDQQQLLKVQRTQLDDSLAKHLQELDHQRQALQQNNQLLQDARLRMEERELQLRAAVTDVNQRLGRSGNEWMVAEAEYLIRLAGYRLKLARDPHTAAAALTLADSHLKDTLDPGWADVREQLARDLANLAALNLPDVDGLARRLGALSTQLDEQALAGEHPATIPAAGEPSLESNEKNLRTLWRDFQRGLKESIRIRRSDRPNQALQAPEPTLHARQMVKLQLEAAQQGLMRADVRLYQDSLTAAQRWITDLFRAEDSDTPAILATLQNLSTIDVRPPLPDISRSLSMLKARDRLRKDVADNPDANERTPLAADSPQ